MKANAHQLLAFAQVIREGSFSAAAQKMGVTQSALSQHVGKLEERVGTRLMTRSASGLDLTRTGAELFALAEQFSSLTTEIEERLSGYGSFESGHLNIIANAPQPALRAIARYGRAYPNVQINFTLVDWTRTQAMLSDHAVDIAFITRPRMTRDCVYRKVCETTYVFYVPAGHPWAGRRRVSLAALAQETLILPERGSLTQKVVSAALGQRGIVPRRQLTTTTFPVMKEAILHGVGVGIFLSEATAPSDALVEVEIEELTERFEIHIASPKQKAGLRLIQSFWEEVQEDRFMAPVP